LKRKQKNLEKFLEDNPNANAEEINEKS